MAFGRNKENEHVGLTAHLDGSANSDTLVCLALGLSMRMTNFKCLGASVYNLHSIS